MTKKSLAVKSTSGVKKPKGRKFTTEEARRGGKANKRERISDLLTVEQKQELLEKAYSIAMTGDTVLLKSFTEQVWGRPVARIESKVQADVTIQLINYGDDTV
jgi:hypothetical protein